MKAYLAYRCGLCGDLIVSDTPSDIPLKAAPSFCASVIRNQQMAGNPYLYQAPGQMVHHCADGHSCGIAQFAGVKYI